MWFQSLFIRERPSSSSVLQKGLPTAVVGWCCIFRARRALLFEPRCLIAPLPLTTTAAAAEVTLNLFASFVPWMNDVQ